MDRTDNVIDFARYRSRRQARRLGEMMWAVYAWQAGYALPKPSANYDDHSRRA